ncbi:MAG: phosphatidyl-myo-inositol alpha-mannosyltransferase [Patescibacteria group bacterium]|nr:glycosyltransferase family 4 protein [Candidatus Saccharibacteria bacterium]MDQ5963629.1 phosphatidyl-myo-inositol alpha-mannosyltransferase [Patescibacteria group bacterium]
MKSLRIGFVLDGGLDSPDGVQQNVLAFGEWLRSKGHQVYFLVGGEPKLRVEGAYAMARNISVKFNGNKLTIPLPANKKHIARTLAELRLNILHVQTPYSPLMAGRIIKAAHHETACVGTFHILAYSKLVVWANVGLALLNLPTRRFFRLHLAVSEPAALFAKKTYGYSCQIMPNPFAMRRFESELLASASQTRSEVSIVFLGRLVPRKGALELLRAITYLRDDLGVSSGFRVRIGGKGEQAEALQRYVKKHRLESVVTFVGFIPEEDKAQFLASADIAVFPSTSGESFGISLLEAMAASRGVVLGGDNPGYRSVMAPKFETQLIDPKDPKKFAQHLFTWIRDAPARHNAAVSQGSYVKRFDIETLGPALLECYAQALQMRNKQA